MTSEEHIAKFDEARAKEIWRVAVDLQKQVLELRAENHELWRIVCGVYGPHVFEHLPPRLQDLIDRVVHRRIAEQEELK